MATFFLHGYHLGVEDSEIYLPAIKKLIHPALYPFAPEFFLSHGHLSLFSPVVAWTAMATGLSADWAILLWYVLTLYAMAIACWMVAKACFESTRARWGAVLLTMAVLTMPATNTGLLLMDPYLTARSMSTPLTLIALASLLERRFVRAGVAAALTATVHPQMAVYLLFLMGVILVHRRIRARSLEPAPAMASLALILPGGFHLGPATGPYREALFSRDYFFLSTWAWYHWLGMIGPLAILGWFWRSRLRKTTDSFACLSFAMIPFGMLSILAAGILSSSTIFEMFVRLQPLRTFHLITLVLILLLGGVAGEFCTGKLRWAGIAALLAAAVGLGISDVMLYPASPHVEWPAKQSENAWINTLLWVRQNTPENAVFAVDSRYFLEPGVDTHGFRSISERSALADYYKDSGVVSLFPALAPEWKQMTEATNGLNHFSLADFKRLETQYPAVSWTVINGTAPAGLVCPFVQGGYSVCKLPAEDAGRGSVSRSVSGLQSAPSSSQNAPTARASAWGIPSFSGRIG
ncbi:MAG: hypothetical protein KGN79_07210 [Acidobacteriota bacterium]|nr:hypothetical protein [Acidobacteriota bacterium]